MFSNVDSHNSRETSGKVKSVCWVPCQLLETHQNQGRMLALNFLTQYKLEVDLFLHRVVTVFKKWVHYWTPASKQASMQWEKKDKTAPGKFKCLPFAGKVLATVFWDQEGILLIEYVLQGSTITFTSSYFDITLHLFNAIEKKRHGTLSKIISLFHENARLHMADQTQWLLLDLKWEVFGHQLYHSLL